MLVNLFKVNKDKNIQIKIPNQNECLSICLIDYVVNDDGLKVINVKINNRDDFKQYTDNVLKYYVDREMKSHLKLYSIEYSENIFFEIL